MKSLYQKIANQTASLKGLWASKLNLSGRAGMATEADLMSYDRKLHELEAELERRKELGRRFQTVLQRVMEIEGADEKFREDHQVN